MDGLKVILRIAYSNDKLFWMSFQGQFNKEERDADVNQLPARLFIACKKIFFIKPIVNSTLVDNCTSGIVTFLL